MSENEKEEVALPLTGSVTTIDTIEQRIDGRWEKHSRQTTVIEYRGEATR